MGKYFSLLPVLSASSADSTGADSGSTYLIYGRDFTGTVAQEGAIGNDTLTGTSAAENIVGGRGNDTLDGAAGIDALQGGAGDDTLYYDSIDRRIDGGNGEDSLRVTNGGASFDGSEHRVRNIETIDLRGGVSSTLLLDTLDVLDVGSASHALRILGDSNDLLNLAGTWSVGTGADTGFTRYEAGALQVDVSSSIALFNGGVMALSALDGGNGFRLDVTGTSKLSYRVGNSVSGGADLNGDGFDDIVIGAQRASYGASRSGSGYVVFGTVSNQIANFDLASLNGSNGFRLDGAVIEDRAGYSVSMLGDVDGDGFADLLLGAPYAGSGDAGASYLVFGTAQSTSSTLALNTLNGTTGVQLTGFADTDSNGRDVSGLGDFNGDGFDDLAVVSLYADHIGTDDVGKAYVVLGNHDEFPAKLGLGVLDSASGFALEGAAARQVQIAGRAGDINGDGLDDLILGGPNATAGTGISFVVFGTTETPVSNVDLGTLNGTNGFRVLGLAAGDHSGVSVAGAGDFNGDGFEDFIIGANDADPHGANSGASYLVFGKATFSADFNLATLNGDNGFRIDGVAAGDSSGKSVAAAGDVNGDGFFDLLIGAPNADVNRSNSGATYILFGAAGGFASSLALSALDGHQGLRFDGRLLGGNLTDLSGTDVSTAGDVDGDGYDDILIGAQGNSGTTGSAYLVYGRDFLGTVDQQGSASNDTLTGSSADEQIIGARGNDILDGVSGADVLLGAAGDDVLVWHEGLRHADGGSGTDTLRIDGSGVILDFSLLANHTVAGIERIDLTGSGDNTLTLDFRDVLKVSDHHTLRIDGNAGDSVTSSGQGWAAGAVVEVDGQQYQSYSHFGGTLLVDSDITQTSIS